jgi:hypothetical protein
MDKTLFDLKLDKVDVLVEHTALNFDTKLFQYMSVRLH